jgi:hypothetical protein
MQCKNCGELLSIEYPNRVYCNRLCAKEYNKTRYVRRPEPTLPTGTVGAMHEMLACADLLRRGYAVFRAVSPSCICDLIVLNKDRLVRVEVTTGYRKNDKLLFPKKDPSKFDLLLVVEHNGTVNHFESSDVSILHGPIGVDVVEP